MSDWRSWTVIIGTLHDFNTVFPFAPLLVSLVGAAVQSYYFCVLWPWYEASLTTTLGNCLWDRPSASCRITEESAGNVSITIMVDRHVTITIVVGRAAFVSCNTTARSPYACTCTHTHKHMYMSSVGRQQIVFQCWNSVLKHSHTWPNIHNSSRHLYSKP